MNNAILKEEFETESQIDSAYGDLTLDGKMVSVSVATGGSVELGKKYRVTVTVEEIDA